MSDKNHMQGEHGKGRVNPAHQAGNTMHGTDKARIEHENEYWKESQQAKEKEQEELDPEA